MKALRVYWLLLVWQYRRYKRFLPMIIVIQLALAVGIIYGLAFLIPNIDAESALYLATGAPTISLVIMGLTVVPQEVSQGKLTGRFDYLSSLPIPRLAMLASDVTYWLLAQLPGTALALVVASIKFRFGFQLHWALVPAVLLVAFAGATVGYAMAMALHPQVSNQITNFLSIGILLFSPVDFPMDRLPGFLQAIHTVLPIKYMADLIRWSLTGHGAARPGVAFAVVCAWCAAGLATSYRLSTKRR